MANCAQRLVTITFRLENRSDIQPAVGEKSTNGRMMIAARTVLISLALAARVLRVAREKFRRHRRAQRNEHELGGIIIQ